MASDVDADEVEIGVEAVAADNSEPAGEENDRREFSEENAYKRTIYSIPVDVHVTPGTARVGRGMARPRSWTLMAPSAVRRNMVISTCKRGPKSATRSR